MGLLTGTVEYLFYVSLYVYIPFYVLKIPVSFLPAWNKNCSAINLQSKTKNLVLIAKEVKLNFDVQMCSWPKLARWEQTKLYNQ